jgi:hypothetical protein
LKEFLARCAANTAGAHNNKRKNRFIAAEI